MGSPEENPDGAAEGDRIEQGAELRSDADEPLQMPIDGALDLHTFRPNEIGDLIPDYLALCQARGIYEVRIIHGKGVGNLRRGVEALLPRLPIVESFGPASALYGGSGATMVRLRKPGAGP